MESTKALSEPELKDSLEQIIKNNIILGAYITRTQVPNISNNNLLIRGVATKL